MSLFSRKSSRVISAEERADRYRKSFYSSASSYSKEIEREYEICPWCGTRYTEHMIEKLPSLTCINCGGTLVEE